MATHTGSEGYIKTGTSGGDADTIVASVRSYSIDHTADTIETSSIGTVARTYQSSLTGFSGSLDVFWDETDTGQTSLSVGSQVAFAVYPEGDDTGATYYYGEAIITSLSISGSYDGMVEATISVQGTGALSTATVSA